MTCARYADLDFVERYVLGQMDEAEQASFEAHFFECPDCFAAVQAMQAAQSVLRESPTQPASSSRVVDFGTHARVKNGSSARDGSPGSRLLSIGATWIGLAAAASLAGLMIWTPWRAKGPASGSKAESTSVAPTTNIAQPATGGAQSSTPSNATATAQPAGTGGGAGAATGPGPGPASIRSPIDFDTLALVMPPPYVPLQTRGADAGSGDAFAAAMTKYTAKDYRGAVDALKPVVEAQPDAMHAQFFLGVSYLAVGEPSAASAVLNRVAASNVAPFADEAHFYLAKAALRAHDLDRAERELSIAIERQAGPPNEASKLLQALRLYRRAHAHD